MNRREFVTGSATLAACALDRLAAQDGSAAAPRIQLKVDVGRTLGTIPPDFLGLGYEISSVAVAGLLSAQNRT